LGLLSDLMAKNPDRRLYQPSHPNFLFNQPLANGKTLMYMACQEGQFDIVEFFLYKGMNPTLRSKSDENEYETCLEVSVRWNYISIVNILLEHKFFTANDIEMALKITGIKKNMRNVLKSYLTASKRKKGGCACF
jgi:hypothetical protein